MWDGDGSSAYFLKNGSGFTAPAGDFSRLTVAGTGSSTLYTRAYSDSTKATFDYLGNMVRVTDSWGNISKFGYDGTSRLTNIYDPADTTRSIVLTYRTQGLDSIRDPFGRGTRITLDTVHLDAHGGFGIPTASRRGFAMTLLTA